MRVKTVLATAIGGVAVAASLAIGGVAMAGTNGPSGTAPARTGAARTPATDCVPVGPVKLGTAVAVPDRAPGTFGKAAKPANGNETASTALTEVDPICGPDGKVIGSAGVAVESGAVGSATEPGTAKGGTAKGGTAKGGTAKAGTAKAGTAKGGTAKAGTAK